MVQHARICLYRRCPISHVISLHALLVGDGSVDEAGTCPVEGLDTLSEEQLAYRGIVEGLDLKHCESCSFLVQNQHQTG